MELGLAFFCYSYSTISVNTYTNSDSLIFNYRPKAFLVVMVALSILVFIVHLVNQVAILQIHFRQEHFLCEDEACLSKKFIVFTSEAEMKVPYGENNNLYLYI